MWDKFKSLMLYGGLSKDEFYLVYDDIWEANRVGMVRYTAITAVGMTIMLILSFSLDVLASSRYSYIACASAAAIMLVLCAGPAKKHQIITRITEGIFTSLLLLFGIILGTIVEPNQASASYFIMLFVATLLFTDTPFLTDLQLILSIIVYLVIASYTQSAAMFAFNLSVVAPYGAVSTILSASIMKDKIVRHYLSYENKLLSEKDQLTGLYNRRCFDQKINDLEENGCNEGSLFCAFDVNGLKRVNDSLGHKAGDELICGAAECIKSVFGIYGTCYRTGGDEFFAIIDGEHPDIRELQEELNNKCLSFKGKFVSDLSISAGIVTYNQGDTVDAVVQKADDTMYEVKNKYYADYVTPVLY